VKSVATTTTRRSRSSWPAPPTPSTASSGRPAGELLEWWRTGFAWRAQEAAINRYPHFRATVDGVGLHFLHLRGRGPAPLPLLLTHGWPSSFLELLPLLTDPSTHGGDADDAFDLVIPSLPGYGFSDPLPGRGASASRPPSGCSEST
jgi:hypothetical protein